MRIIAGMLVALMLSLGLAACQIVSDEELAEIRAESYAEGKDTAESLLDLRYHNGYELGYDEGYDEGYEKGQADKEAEAAQQAKEEAAKQAQQKSSSSASSSSSSASSGQSQTQSVTVYVTDTGSKYHRSGCQYLRQSQHAISLSSAKAAGYTACSRCGPPA